MEKDLGDPNFLSSVIIVMEIGQLYPKVLSISSKM